MNKMFYARLAVDNIKKNRQTYIPYLLTCTLTVMMYFIIRSLIRNPNLLAMHGGGELGYLLGLGSWVVMIFAVIFLFYTNSFLIKRRKKEFGLFNMLGMEKRHLGKMMLWESLYTAFISLFGGIGVGVLFSHLVYLLLIKLLHFPGGLEFAFSGTAVIEAAALFGGIYLINLLNTIRQIHFANPVELLSGGQVGEKEPKAKWVLALFGFICLGSGYYLAVTVESPAEALLLFFVAVILVIIGTYCIFTAGSIVILKMLKKNKKFYYQPRHFTTISGMMYRMKQNAAGLASICVLSSGVLILISTTVSLYIGMEDSMVTRYPRHIMIQNLNTSETERSKAERLVDQELEKNNLKPENVLSYYEQNYMLKQEGSSFQVDKDSMFYNGLSANMPAAVELITLADYNTIAGEQKTLDKDEVLLYQTRGEKLEGTITIENKTLRIKEHLEDFILPPGEEIYMVDCYYLVVPDFAFLEEMRTLLSSAQDAKGIEITNNYILGFDLAATDEVQVQIKDALHQKLTQDVEQVYVLESRAENKQSFYLLDGGLFFLGVFLGLLFLMATVLIIYYKQISEGYDDRARYQIMQKVGMSQKEVRQSIRSQVISVFFLPLLAAGIHVVFAFPMIDTMLKVMGLMNTNLFLICTGASVLIFGLCYLWVYWMTAKTYYKIVS